MDNDRYLIEDELKISKEMSKIFIDFFINGKDIFCPPKKFWPFACVEGEEFVEDEECQNCLYRYIRDIAIKNLEKNGIKLRRIYDY